MIPQQHRKKAGWAAIAVVCVSGFEGCRQYAYRDPVGIPTVCFGETRGVHLGQHFTRPECENMLGDRLQEFDAGVRKCVRIEMPATREAAMVSFAYNLGVGGFCRSSVARLLNENRPREACDALLHFNTARGIPLPGLTRRRQEERKLCLEGL